MKLAVIGTGYVGLVTAAGFAEAGHDVICVDRDRDRIAALTRGEVPFHEPGLPALVARNAARLAFTTELAGVRDAAIVFLAVPTPAAADGSADLGALDEVATQLAPLLARTAIAVVKSTVPPGTAARLRETLGVATMSNPEFLREGSAVADCLSPARIVLGADGDPQPLVALYAGRGPIHAMSTRSAELTKYAANAMLATRISFMNELARLAEVIGADIESVRTGIGSDPRIGTSYLRAGAGYGGACLPKDVRALLHAARSVDVPLGIVEATARANERQLRAMFAKLEHHFGSLAGKRIAIWGLAFKPETDDLRDAPALALVHQLLAAGASVCAFDPVAMPAARAMLGDRIDFADDAYAAATSADALVLATEWDELRRPDFARLAMRTRVLVDGRNAWTAPDGFTYYAVGR